MSDCYHKTFVLNNRIRSCNEFDEDHIRHGISPYEVIRIINGVPLFLEDHIERFENSLASKQLEHCHKLDNIKANIELLIQSNKVESGNVKLLYNYRNSKLNCLLYFIKHRYPNPEEYRDGVKLGLYHAIRENPNTKLFNKKLKIETSRAKKDQGVYEVLLIDTEGNITEGSMSNVFFIRDEGIFTPPLASVLPGITRKHIFSICSHKGIQLAEKVIKYDEIEEFDAAFITGTSPGVLPVRQVENFSFNQDNILLRKLMEEYDRSVKNYLRNF